MLDHVAPNLSPFSLLPPGCPSHTGVQNQAIWAFDSTGTSSFWKGD